MSTRLFAILAVVSCIAVTDPKIQPGIIYDMAQRPVDPDPTADPNRMLQAQPFAEAGSGSLNGKQQLALAVAATLAAMLAGMMPAIFFVGKFDENRWFRR